ncbi:MAG TPA: HDIG domain-containing protein [Clostridiales bacterium]|nr:HDIG domain-containing protein [Clostridiales bacterium]
MSETKPIENNKKIIDNNNNKKIIFANSIIIFACVIFLLTVAIIRFNIMDGRPLDKTIIPYVSLLVIFALCFCVILFALKYLDLPNYNTKMFGVICFIIAVNYAVCILIEKLSIFAMPVTLTVLLLSVFTNAKTAFLGNVFSALMLFITLTAMAVSGGQPIPQMLLPIIIFTITAGTILSIVINTDIRRFTYVIRGSAVNLISLPIIILYQLIIAPQSFMGLLSELPFAAFMVLGTVLLALLLQPIIEVIFNINSNFRFMELCDHHRPLLLRLAKSAPGTFNHSLTVANLAETCARAINENTYFARAAAYYHDVGKLNNTRFFKENQFNDTNPHDGLTPEVSCDIIRKHASQGKQVCAEYRIPQEIADITAEHHGTMPIFYFYNKAKEMTDREINIKEYCYQGPIPSSKVAAIIMICDAAEATVRAMKEPTYEKVEKTVKDIIDQRLRYGQFDNCDITLKELAIIKNTIVHAFGGLYHERIQYPEV